MKKQTQSRGGKQAPRVIRRLWSYPVKYFRAPLIIFFVFVALSVACNVLGPRILGLATTKIFTDVIAVADGAQTGVDFAYIGRVAGALLCLYGASYFFQYMQGRLMTRITNRSTYHIRNDIAKKLASLPPAYFDGRPRAAVLSHITNDADVVAVTFNQVMTQTANSAFTMIGVSVMMFSMNPLLGGVVFALLPASVLISLLLSRHSHKYYTGLQKHMGALSAAVQDAYDARGTRPFSSASARAFQKANQQVYEDAWRGNALSGAAMPGVNALSTVAYVAVCLLGALLLARGQLTIGELQAFIQYVRSFSQPLTQLSWISNSVQGLLASAQNIFEFLDAEETDPLPKGASEGYDVSFENVAFSRGTFHEKNLTLRVPEGYAVAITGPSGAGKTTLMELLLGIVRPDEGCVRIGGADPAALAGGGIFGAVLQTPWLQSETIAENIAYGRPDVSAADIQNAARRVGADRIVQARAGGYSARVGERLANLSRGEIQLLQAARLECSDPRILVLDEAFDSLDALTFRRLYDVLIGGRPDATKFFSTDEPSLLADADIVVFMKDGRAEAVGKHADILVSSASYAAFIRGLERRSEED